MPILKVLPFLEGAEGTPSSGKKKEKIRYTYRTSEEVIEEVTKGGVHKMAREYRYLTDYILHLQMK